MFDRQMWQNRPPVRPKQESVRHKLCDEASQVNYILFERQYTAPYIKILKILIYLSDLPLRYPKYRYSKTPLLNVR